MNIVPPVVEFSLLRNCYQVLEAVADPTWVQLTIAARYGIYVYIYADVCVWIAWCAWVQQAMAE